MTLENQGTETTATELTTTAEVSSPAAAEGATGDTVEGGEPSPYTPNLKFKVMDQEKEFAPWVKNYIKDAESEKNFRDLFERAEGLNHVKQDRQTLRSENTELKSELGSVKTALTTVGDFLKNDDLDSFFEAFNLSEEQILKYAVKRLQLKDMPPAQQAEYQRQRQQQQEYYALKRQNEELSRGYTETTVQQRSSELDQTLASPQVSAVVQAFDSRMGRQGAFREEVIRRGQYHAYTTNVDVPVEQVVKEVLSLVHHGDPGQQLGTPLVNGGSAVQQAAGQAPVQKKPVIPNIQGRGTSPVKKIPRSIDDLKKLAASMDA